MIWSIIGSAAREINAREAGKIEKPVGTVAARAAP
jgi:hypothetical protein